MSHLTRNKIILLSIIVNVILATLAIYNFGKSFTFFTVFSVLEVLALIVLVNIIKDSTQKKHSLLRNFPFLARLRWVFESERSKIQQYFIEDNTNGTPYNREKRSDVYQKSKNQRNTTPFGTQYDVYGKGYEFVKHSMFPKNAEDVNDLTVNFGTKFTKQPFETSIFNISAMSYGSLSEAAIRSLNEGAKLGNFYHNTGEGGISPYHLQGGDLVFQIGTGYFGCGETDSNGIRQFNEAMFKVNSKLSQVKMIEVKLSQGAKPGHGGILPGSKNTKEIAEIRGIEKAGVDVISPPSHTAFNSFDGMLDFIQELRNLSGGKPVGIKMCVGNYDEVEKLISLMRKTDRYPDFITIDGSEGGTGAAPFVYSNNIGTPLTDALIYVVDSLKKNGLYGEIKVIASGKVSNSFDIIKMFALGAHSVNAARAFMLSLGCIQARECNKDTCPVGIATQNKTLIKGLDVNLKKVRVYNYHKNLMHEVKEVVGAMGLTNINQVTGDKLYVRVSENELRTVNDYYN